MLHTVGDGLPIGDIGDIVPVVLPTNGVGIVPNAVPGIIGVGDILIVDGIIVAVLPPVDVKAAPGAIDGVGADLAAAAGSVAAATRDDVTGIVVPGI